MVYLHFCDFACMVYYTGGNDCMEYKQQKIIRSITENITNGKYSHRLPAASQLAEEFNVPGQIQGGLAGQTDHHTGANLKTGRPQIFERSHTVVKIVFSRMDPGKNFPAGTFYPQKITICPGLFPALENFQRLFAAGERQTQCRKIFPDGRNDFCYKIHRLLISAFPSLQYNRTVSAG